MKRTYDSPEMRWVPIRSSRAVAEVCWGHANNRKPFYYNTYGTGYAELYAIGKGCNSNTQFKIEYFPETMSTEERQKADEDMQRVIANVMATIGNNPNNYKGSVFSAEKDDNWS